MVKAHAQRPGAQLSPPGLGQAGPLIQQRAHALDAGPRPLQAVDVVPDLDQRPAQERQVVDQQIDRADGHPPAPIEIDADGQDGGLGQQEGGRPQRPARALHQHGPAPGVEHGAHQAVEPGHDIGLAPVGANVLRRRQPLAQETGQLAKGPARLAPRRDRRPLHGARREGDPAGIGHGDPPDAPVLQKEEDHDAQRQQAVARQAQGHLGEKLGQGGHVAVDALDQLAGGVRLVKGHVQAQDVGGQVAAQGVGGRPGNALAEIGRPKADGLDDDGRAQVDQGRPRQFPGRRPGLGGVDKRAHDLRVDQLQANARDQKPGQQQDARPLRPQILDQQFPVGMDRDVQVALHGRCGWVRATKKAVSEAISLTARASRGAAMLGAAPSGQRSASQIDVYGSVTFHCARLLSRWTQMERWMDWGTVYVKINGLSKCVSTGHYNE